MTEASKIAQFPPVGRVVEQQLRDMDAVHELRELLDRLSVGDWDEFLRFKVSVIVLRACLNHRLRIR